MKVMTPQVFPYDSAAPEAELQREFERLFGEIELMLDNLHMPQQQAAVPIEHWAYMPGDDDIEIADNLC